MKKRDAMNWMRLAAGALVLSTGAWAESGGAPVGVTGAPEDGTCADCHEGILNSGGGKLQIALVNATNWTPGQPVTLRVTLSDPKAQRWGFQLTARSASKPASALGTLAATDTAATQVKTAGGLQFITHRSAGTRMGTSGSVSWDMQWTPPAEAGAGDVTFYAAGNAANNNGDNSGDKIYTTSLTVAPGAPVTGTAKLLPVLAFGSQAEAGTWYTAVYLTNTTANAVEVPLSFFGADGQALSVASAGGAQATVSVAARGTAFVEFNDGVPLTQGWMLAQMPDGVTGYGVVRRTLEGTSDAEMTAPLLGSTTTVATLGFDEKQVDTRVAVVNPTGAEIAVKITVRDEAGAEVGTSTLALGAKRRETFLLRDRPELAGMVDKRGSAEFSVTSGAVSVVGLRYRGLSFTPVLAAER